MLQTIRALALLLCLGTAASLSLAGLTGCRPKPQPAPYAQQPDLQALLDATAPQLAAIQVADATVVANRGLRGRMAFIAQGPNRFRGQVHVAGNELVTLALHEQGYALRYKLDAFPEGYYAGPPSACAVSALLGVSLRPEELVNLVLGGAPIIAAPFDVVGQAWDKTNRYEKVTIANASTEQELRFGWKDGRWLFVGSKIWRRAGGQRGKWVWTIQHQDFRADGGAMLPKKTIIETPGKRRTQRLVINYKQRDTDPAFARKTSAGDGAGHGGGDEAGDGAAEAGAEAGAEGGAEGGGDDWGDDGWENEDPPSEGEPAADAPAKAEAAAVAPTPAPKPASKPKVPEVFLLSPGGLTVRGDLCRRS